MSRVFTSIDAMEAMKESSASSAVVLYDLMTSLCISRSNYVLSPTFDTDKTAYFVGGAFARKSFLKAMENHTEKVSKLIEVCKFDLKEVSKSLSIEHKPGTPEFDLDVRNRIDAYFNKKARVDEKKVVGKQQDPEDPTALVKIDKLMFVEDTNVLKPDVVLTTNRQEKYYTLENKLRDLEELVESVNMVLTDEDLTISKPDALLVVVKLSPEFTIGPLTCSLATLSDFTLDGVLQKRATAKSVLTKLKNADKKENEIALVRDLVKPWCEQVGNMANFKSICSFVTSFEGKSFVENSVGVSNTPSVDLNDTEDNVVTTKRRAKPVPKAATVEEEVVPEVVEEEVVPEVVPEVVEEPVLSLLGTTVKKSAPKRVVKTAKEPKEAKETKVDNVVVPEVVEEEKEEKEEEESPVVLNLKRPSPKVVEKKAAKAKASTSKKATIVDE